MTDIVVAALVVLLVGAAVRYLIKAKRRGVKCVGCPYSCSGTEGGCCSCDVAEVKE